MTTALVIIGYILVAVLMIVGLVLSAINLPGIWLIFLGTLLAAFISEFQDITWYWLILFFIFAVAGSLLDNLIVLVTTKKMGASKWGLIGAVVGMIVGLFIGGIFGVIIGPFIGVVLFEILFDRKNMTSHLNLASVLS